MTPRQYWRSEARTMRSISARLLRIFRSGRLQVIQRLEVRDAAEQAARVARLLEALASASRRV